MILNMVRADMSSFYCERCSEYCETERHGCYYIDETMICGQCLDNINDERNECKYCDNYCYECVGGRPQ